LLQPHPSPGSPGQGSAAIVRPQRKRREKAAEEGGEGGGASIRSNGSRSSSPKPAPALGSKHAHSILHTCLIRGPSSPEHPPPPRPLSPPPDSSSVGASQGGGGRQLPLGLTPPAMSSNELQVWGTAFIVAFSMLTPANAHSSASVRGC
jgi:hypothetical protein